MPPQVVELAECAGEAVAADLHGDRPRHSIDGHGTAYMADAGGLATEGIHCDFTKRPSWGFASAPPFTFFKVSDRSVALTGKAEFFCEITRQVGYKSVPLTHIRQSSYLSFGTISVEGEGFQAHAVGHQTPLSPASTGSRNAPTATVSCSSVVHESSFSHAIST